MKETDRTTALKIYEPSERFGKNIMIAAGGVCVNADLFSRRGSEGLKYETGQEIGNVLLNLKAVCEALEEILEQEERNDRLWAHYPGTE